MRVSIPQTKEIRSGRCLQLGVALFSLFAAVLPSEVPAQSTQTSRDSAFHVLNRLAFGARPQDVEEVLGIGIQNWIDRQLRMSPDPQLRQRESEFQILKYSGDELAREFREGQRKRREERERRQAEMDKMDESTSGAEQEATRKRNRDGMDSMRALRGELQQLTLVRAILAENQLHEVLTDFWFNHFNVFLGKGADRYLLPGYVEEVIRPNAMLRFEDLLIATAESPAMLFYLDNVQSIAEGAVPPRLERALSRSQMGMVSEEQRKQLERVEARLPKGLNENYARELLELHTLGVDGGYTQQDVIEVARILTGWGMQRPTQGAAFEYHDWAHDRGHKMVLGESFPAGEGREEGIRLLRMLARHPATIHHVSSKLVERLVGDEIPDGAVDAAVYAWRESDGDIRAIVRAIVSTPEFWSPTYRSSKFKSPFEFVVSSVRSVNGAPDNSPRLSRVVAGLGQPIYLQAVPTGYPETSEDWVSSSALLSRMNFAVGMAAGRVPGVELDLDSVIEMTRDYPGLVDQVNDKLLGGTMTERTRRVILDQIADIREPRQARALAVGLALGGPEFQRQ